MKNSIQHFLKHTPKWHYHVFILILTIGISLSFLWGAPLEPPMTDSYIHYKYAQNLASYGELSYNLGATEGIGTSSVFWVVVLALFQKMGISPLVMSKILGISFLFISGVLVFELSLKVFDSNLKPIHLFTSAGIAVLGLLSGSMVWIALSGMETILFLMLGLLSIWLYTRKSWIFLGITLGLLTLTRIEGITLAGVLVLVELIRWRKITPGIVKIIVPLVLVIAPWFIYLQMREGAPVSTSFQGRQYVVAAVEERITAQFPFLYWVQKIYPLIHFVSWAYFIFTFIAGSISLPGLNFSLGGNIVGNRITIPLAGILVFCLSLPLIILSLKKAWHSTRFRSLQAPCNRLKIVLLGWFFLFNLAYALFLPRPGSAGRYATINHLAFWISLLLGALLIKKPKLRALAMVFVVFLFGIGLNYWRTVYRANVDYMANVPKKAAVFIDTHYPSETPIGATDLGAIGYYSDQPVVDLFGYINQDFNKFMQDGGKTSDYLAKVHLCYLMLYDSLDDAGLDFSEEMELTNDPRFSLSLEQSYSIPVEEWELGNGPLKNYMPAISIYRLDWHDQTACQ